VAILQIDSVYFGVVAACFVIVGAVELGTKRCFFLSAKKYTADSLRAFSVYDGCVEIALGAAVFALQCGGVGRKLCLVILIGALTYYSVQMGRILVKK
jgi:hypothetical protein